MKPWDRQAFEDDQSFGLFQAYLFAHPRSEYVCAERASIPIQEYRSMMRIYGWEHRASEYDAYMSAALQKAEAEDAEEIRKRHLAPTRELIEALTSEVRAFVELTRKGIHGNVRPTQLPRMLESAIKLERLIVGEVTERVESTGPDYSRLSDEELETLDALERKAS